MGDIDNAGKAAVASQKPPKGQAMARVVGSKKFEPQPAPKPEANPTLEKHLDRRSIRIRCAALRDAKKIAALAETLSRPTAKSGALETGYSVEDYERFALRADHFLVLLIGDTIRGFVLAYSSDLLTQDTSDQAAVQIRDTFCRNFIFINQVAVAPGSMHKGFAQALYKELFARVLLFVGTSVPLYTVIDGSPPHPRAVLFHNKIGFQQEAATENADGTTALVFSHRALRTSLNECMAQNDLSSSPFYTAHAMEDKNCVGVGICLYTIAPPDETGAFYSEVRIMFKWRQPGIEEHYRHPRGSGSARTPIKLDGDYKIRVPRYALNKLQVDESSAPYAYIDKDDPPDVITMQLVLRGTFNCALDLSNFPADTQMLPFRFRMWDSDPDDRCRYFRQLPTVDGTAWPICVKGKITAIECTFLANQVHIGMDAVAETSYLQVDVPCVRKTWYFIRTVALPLFFISSLAITSVGIDKRDFSDRGSQNGGLLLTAVAFMFIAKEGLPRFEYMTRLDTFTTVSFFMMWMMIMFQFLSVVLDLDDDVDFWVGVGLGGALLVLLVYKMLRLGLLHHHAVTGSPSLGDLETSSA